MGELLGQMVNGWLWRTGRGDGAQGPGRAGEPVGTVVPSREEVDVRAFLPVFPGLVLSGQFGFVSIGVEVSIGFGGGPFGLGSKANLLRLRIEGALSECLSGLGGTDLDLVGEINANLLVMEVGRDLRSGLLMGVDCKGWLVSVSLLCPGGLGCLLGGSGFGFGLPLSEGAMLGESFPVPLPFAGLG